MSSKDRSQLISSKSHHNSAGGDSNGKRDSSKYRKKEEEKGKLKEDKPSESSKNQIEDKHRRKLHVEESVVTRKEGNSMDTSSRHNKKIEEKLMNNDEYEREERRRRRKEKENKNFKNETGVRSKDEMKDRESKQVNEREERRRRKITEDNNNETAQREEDTKRKHRSSKDENVDRQKIDKNELYSKHKYDKESSKKHKSEKNDLNNKQRTDKEESHSRNVIEKDEFKNKNKPDKEEFIIREKTGKDESRNKHKLDIDDSKGNREKERDKLERKCDDKRKSNVYKSGDVIDSQGDKIEKRKEKYEDAEYEEDFDEYNDDDFEDVDSSSTILSADNMISVDVPQLKSVKHLIEPSTRIENREKVIPKNQEGIHTSFINFRMAQKKCSNDIVANKMLSRAFDLSRLIDLDRSHFDIVDIAPVMEHNKYMRLFGKAGCTHEGSQTGDDNMARESQTEVIEERTLWSQHPPLDDEGCVRVIMDTTYSAHVDFLTLNESSKTTLEMLTEIGGSSAPLIYILELMDRVLEEEASPEVATKISSTQNGQQIMSLGYNKYSYEDSLCTLATFATGNSCLFASVHQKVNIMKNTKRNDNNSFVCIWRVSSSRREPLRLLSCPSHSTIKSDITSIIFSPDRSSSHVIAGLDSGLIALWDLREYSSSFDSTSGDPPAYLTGILDNEADQSHRGPVIALHTSCNETASSSYQLLSIDIFGNLSIWIVSSLNQNGFWALSSGSMADLNLRPGSRSRISIIANVSLFLEINTTSSITCMTVDPTNPSHIFIGTNDGKIIYHERSAQKSKRNSVHHNGRIYGSLGNYTSAAITQIDFYPFFEPYLIAGYDDGSINIFSISRTEPILSFYGKHESPVIMCQWSRSHPAVFFSLDTKGNLNLWNILINVYNPVLTQAINGYIGFDLSSDSRWQLKEEKTINNKARLLMWALNGSIEVHELHSSFVDAELDDCFKTCSLFQSLL